MPDDRFFTCDRTLSLREAALIAGAAAPGFEGTIRHVASLGEDDLSHAAVFTEKPAAAKLLAARQFGLCLASNAAADALSGVKSAVLRVKDPRAAFAALARALHVQRTIDDQSLGPPVIASSARVDARAVIGPGAEIGEGAVIGAFSVIGPGVRIGAGTSVGEGASIWCSLIGKDCAIAPGARIGLPGFGFNAGAGGLLRTPQLGRAILGDKVEVGSNSCIDRGAIGDTVIGARTKIDNLVQIAHNVRVGEDCIIAALVGVAGSSIIGDRVLVGGNAGIADHLTIGEDARIAAKAGVISNVPAGEKWGGYPARPVKDWLRGTAAMARAARRGD